MGPPEEGSSQGLRRAFEAHYLTLLKAGVLLTGSRETAEDLVQETFLRAAPQVGSIEPTEQLPYLRTIELNLFRNILRRRRLEKRWHRLEPPRNDAAFEDADEVWRAVLELPARQRACLVLRYYEDLTERETAEALRCSVGTVKSQTSRALEHLRKGLER